MAREQLKTLTEQMYYMMLSLRNDNFGYNIMEEVSKRTQGRVTLGAGTLYALLSRFEKAGIIMETKVEKQKRYYCLTDLGHSILKEEYERLKTLVNDGAELEE